MSEPDTSLASLVEAGASPDKAWVCPYCGNESDENSVCCDEWHREYQTIEEEE